MVSPRLIIFLALVAGVSATAASFVTGVAVQPEPVPVSGSGTAATNTISDEEKSQHREKFFGGDTTRDIRGGQEMKPRW